MNYKAIGNENDLTSSQQQKWIEEQSKVFEEDGIQDAKEKVIGEGDKVWFFNPINKGTNDTVVKDIHWNAFPKKQLDNTASKQAAYLQAENRGNQEEYCEWEVLRDSVTKLPLRAVFTTEGYDYYIFLHKIAPGKVLELYKTYISEEVIAEDLVDGNGNYNSLNKWNVPSINGRRKGNLMHMAVGANAIAAAVKLAAEATWPVLDENGALVTEEQKLIDCLDFGDRARHSDPHIGAMVNSLTRAGNEISFAGPIGLYFHSIDLSGFQTPDGSDPKDWMIEERGKDGHLMRVAFQPPEDSGYKLSDLKIDDKALIFGGQIAEKMEIRVRAIARDINVIPDMVGCDKIVRIPSQPDIEGNIRPNRAESLI